MASPLSEGNTPVLVFILILVMVPILLVAGCVVVYVAFPHRDQEVPGAPWLGDVMKRGVEALPTLDDDVVDRSELARLDEFTGR